jgi:hypothetical protein
MGEKKIRQYPCTWEIGKHQGRTQKQVEESKGANAWIQNGPEGVVITYSHSKTSPLGCGRPNGRKEC